VKLKAAFGGSALPEQCYRVEVYISDNEQRARRSKPDGLRAGAQGESHTEVQSASALLRSLRTMIHTEVIAEAAPRFVVDSMYGAGRGVIKSSSKERVATSRRSAPEMNPGFGGSIPSAGAEPRGAGISHQFGYGNFGLATDGDADRIGAMDERGAFVDPHQDHGAYR